METVTLQYVGPQYSACYFPPIQAEVVRRTKTKIVLRHERLGSGSKDVPFSLRNGFALGSLPERAIGRTGYSLPHEMLIR